VSDLEEDRPGADEIASDGEVPSDWLAAPKVKPLCDALGLSTEAVATAKLYAAAADDSAAVTGQPTPVAAAAVYAASLVVNEKRTQEQVASAADCSVSAIRENWPAVFDAAGIPHGRTRPYRAAHRADPADVDSGTSDGILGRLSRFVRGEES